MILLSDIVPVTNVIGVLIVTLRCKKISEKKKHSVERLHFAYKSINNDESGMIIIQCLSLETSLMNLLRRSLWNLGNFLFVKNTLFKVFLSSNSIDLPEEFLKNMYGYNIIFFSNNFLKANYEIRKVIASNKNIAGRLCVIGGKLDKNFLTKSKMDDLKKYSDKTDIISTVIGLLKIQQIQLIKVLIEVGKIKNQ